MPETIEDAICFLETQWSNLNENKIKGIRAETEFRKYLEVNDVHFIPGGWILIPGKNSKVDIPSQHKICLLPMDFDFSWVGSSSPSVVTPALMSAYNYFRQVGVEAYIVEPKSVDESQFEMPVKSSGSTRALYPRSYELDFKKISPSGNFISENFEDVFSNFPERNGNRGLKCYAQGIVPRAIPPWNDGELVQGLFWFEYARYYCQISYLSSNNDLDLFIIGSSGFAYPVELKSKAAAFDESLGYWFGLDIGPFAKMAFFTSNSMNTDALYVVQEVDDDRNLIDWLGIKFTDLVKVCSWVGRAGGQGMSGSASSTVKIPKLAFSKLSDLLPRL